MTTDLLLKIFSIAVKAGLVSLVVLAFLPFAARAQGCAKWDVTGKWKIKISTGATVNVDIKPSGKYLSATASFEGIGGQGVDNNVYLNGDKFGLVLTWEARDTATGGHNEYYVGTIGSDGIVSGMGRVFGYITQDTPWTSDRAMVCAEKSRYNTVHKLKVTPSKAPEAPPPPTPAPNTPMIVAVPNNLILRPPQMQGTTTLVWDGGKDHPYAEVWVQIDGQDETFVVEQGKGTRQVTVVPGRTYLYILTDAGVRLATVLVRFSQQ